MPASQQLVDRRVAAGISPMCARSHHDECKMPETCKCDCHAHPEAFARRSAEAKARAEAAWATRRAGAAEAKPARGETAPKRPEIKSGVKAAIPAAAAKQIKSEFAVLVWGADQAAATFRPQQWITPDDRLNEQEIGALVNATYNELEARAPGLLRILARAQESAPEAALIYTVAVIALPRLARHGATIGGIKITPELANAVAFAPIVAQLAQQQPTPGAGPAGVGTEPAHVDHRVNGDWQEHAGQPSVAGAPVPPGPAQQAGYGPLPDRGDDQDRPRNGQHAA